MKIFDEDRLLILGALNSLGVLLSEYQHQWSAGERAIFEEACSILGQPNEEGEEWRT